MWGKSEQSSNCTASKSKELQGGVETEAWPASATGSPLLTLATWVLVDGAGSYRRTEPLTWEPVPQFPNTGSLP
jgi:hypothetical protein